MQRVSALISKRIAIFLIVALSMALGASLAFNYRSQSAALAQADTSGERAALSDLQSGFTSVVERVLPSVVSIRSERTVEFRGTPWERDEDFFRDFPFPMPFPRSEGSREPQRREIPSLGSGLIVRADGYVLTNDHVVGGADKVTVKLRDGRELPGTVTRDPKSDLALVKINARDLPAARLGDSSRIKPGQWAIAVGSPFELDQTVTVGVISAVGRKGAVPDEGIVRFYPNLIQTDASINPGNSGGPLLDLEGMVVGINTLIRSSGGGNIGIGFAIPVNTAKFVLNELVAHGKVTRGFMGIVPADLTPKDAETYGVKRGVLVTNVEKGSPADEAGIRVEDVITHFDGKQMTGEIQFRDMVAATAPNKEVAVVVVRDKAEKTLRVRLGKAKDVVEAPPREEAPDKIGFAVAALTPELAKRFGLDEQAKGVVVTRVVSGSNAEGAGVQPGLLILRANDKPIHTVAEFKAVTKGIKSGGQLRMVVESKERRGLIVMALD